MPNGKNYNKNDFIKVFNNIARHRHRYEVFRDFVTMSAISIHNAVKKNDEMEQEYLQIVGQYDKDEVSDLCQLLAILVELLEPEPRDILGDLYMVLELGNNNNGQFFTPPEIALLMAQIGYGNQLKNLDQPYVTLSEPACGAGGMVLAFVNLMLNNKHNPDEKLWVQCIDVDRLAALMCYLQLSLWHVPAEVIVGNTLTMEFRETLYTPAHYMGNWDMRLHYDKAKELLMQAPEEITETDELESPIEKPKPFFVGRHVQSDFGF